MGRRSISGSIISVNFSGVVDRRRLRLPAPEEIAVDDGEYAVGVSCLAAAVGAADGPAAVGVVTTPGEGRRRTALRAAAGRVSRALNLA